MIPPDALADGFADKPADKLADEPASQPDTITAARFLVSGKVQGVWFRASTRDQAQALGLRGHARNLEDGRVEVVAAGNHAGVQALADWLQRGPPRAAVHAVARLPAEGGIPGHGFTIR